MCVCVETWSLTLREERRPRMFKNRMLRKICGPKRDAVTVNWRRLHNGKPYDLYFSPNIISGHRNKKKKVRG